MTAQQLLNKKKMLENLQLKQLKCRLAQVLKTFNNFSQALVVV
jgi:hypothetical protein